jgi:hypothetical protein
MPEPEQGIQPRLIAVDRYFQVSLYLLLLVSVLAVVTTGKLDLGATLLAPLAVLYKGFRWSRSRRTQGAEPAAELSPRAATWLVSIAFLYFPVDLWLMSNTLAASAPNPLLYGALLATIHLMLIALAVRLFSARTLRDHIFLALIAFGNMLAAAILTVDSAFLAFFFVFLVLGVSTFLSLEIRRSAEGATAQPLDPGTPAARRISRALSLTAGSVAFCALLLGGVLFFAIPRFTAGYLGAFNLQPALLTGFGGEVALGRIGEIKKNPAVVMRVRVHGTPTLGGGVHWRGTVLTDFDGHRWFTKPQEGTAVTPDAQGWYYAMERPVPFPPQQFRQSVQRLQNYPRQDLRTLSYVILLEPTASDALFVASNATRLRGSFSHGVDRAGRPMRGSYLSVDGSGSVSNPFHNYTRLLYEGWSNVPNFPPATLRRASPDFPPELREPYLQLPPLDPRIARLAKDVTAGAANEFDRVTSIENYLRSQFGYTLEQPNPPSPDPLAHFLFERKKGHCEYFATAMTILLRTLGIPARYVTGFLPGEFNDIARDYIIRASDAHSWVEVYFPDFGWIAFDPTPPAAARPETFLGQLAMYWDWFELSWNDWVINFDFLHQATMAQNFQRASRQWTERARRVFARWQRRGMNALLTWQARASSAAFLAPLGLAALLIFLLARRRDAFRRYLAMHWGARLSPGGKWAPQLATLQYEEMLRLLARRGWRKSPAQTPLEFAEALAAPELAAPVAELTAAYQDARFGALPADPRVLAQILMRIRALLRAPSPKPPRSA